MDKPRYNSFNLVHKGLRLMLYETAANLQRTDMTNEASGQAVVDQIYEVLYLFESHAHGEDHFFNEPLMQLDRSVSDLFMKEHQEDHRLSAVLVELLSEWSSCETPEQRGKTATKLSYAFNEFIAFNLYHMNKEELELNATLWKHYSDAEIKAIEQNLVQQIPPEKMARYAKWMIRGTNETELVKWLAEVRAFAPPQAYQMLDGIAKEHLSLNAYSRLQVQLVSDQEMITRAPL